ncbi:hypothetical protein [Hymenobacter sp. BRD67]|uniref:hypothetical protein n=1 Tax=Hymenobacter sp. BRD67 TaxID=2675877 RepID=UPI00156550EE|nr:hypothetical protein [Hymenobacter sp. BRD67]QKG52004.1 hypothetical protein GKZ67_04505 [Hymenobacter sp. BRD67]
MNSLRKSLVQIIIVSLLSCLLIISLLVLEVNRQIILGQEWDNDGPASFAFFGRFVLPFMLVALIAIAYTLLLWMLRWNIWPSAFARTGVFLIVIFPMVVFWLVHQQWVINQVTFK